MVSIGAKAHDEKHSSAVAETMCNEETSRHSYSDVRRRSSNFPPWLVSVGAKAHDEKHSSAVAETMRNEETSRHSYSDVLSETKLQLPAVGGKYWSKGT